MRTVPLLLILVVACERQPPPRTTPELAFSRIAGCVDGGGAECLFRELDRDSRWSMASIHRLLTEMRTIIDRAYPVHRRANALGSWTDESRTGDPAAAFAAFCSKRHCLEKLARGFGAVLKVTANDEKSAIVETTRGARFHMALADGEWGLSTFEDELRQAKINLRDTLEQVRRNAAAYDEQRIVSQEQPVPQRSTGSGDSTSAPQGGQNDDRLN